MTEGYHGQRLGGEEKHGSHREPQQQDIAGIQCLRMDGEDNAVTGLGKASFISTGVKVLAGDGYKMQVD